MSKVNRGIPVSSARVKQLFPTLTPAQIRRIATHGRTRVLRPGEVLVEQGDSAVPFFVVISGELEVLRPSGVDETLVTVHAPGQLTGEVSTLSGRRALFRLRATTAGEVIELDRQHLLALLQTDAELGEIVMRAFILRRVELVAVGLGDVVLVVLTHSACTLRIKQFLMRNRHPYSSLGLERDPQRQNLRDGCHIP